MNLSAFLLTGIFESFQLDFASLPLPDIFHGFDLCWCRFNHELEPKMGHKDVFFFLFTGIKPLQFDSPAEKLPNDSLAGFVFLLQAPRPFYVPPLPPPPHCAVS